MDARQIAKSVENSNAADVSHDGLRRVSTLAELEQKIREINDAKWREYNSRLDDETARRTGGADAQAE